MTQRQEVLNVLLAQLLQERGVIAAPEQILRVEPGAVRLPDVLVDFQGLRLMIEAEFKGAGAERAAYDKARERVETAIAHIGVAVVYPAELKRTAFKNLKRDLESATLKYIIVNEAVLTFGLQLGLFTKEGDPRFSEGGIDDLVEALSRCYEQLVRDETLERAVARLQADIDWFALAVSTKSGPLGRLADALNVGESSGGETKETDRRRQRAALVRVTALILGNAMIFQQVLSEKEKRVPSIQDVLMKNDLSIELSRIWHLILVDINYYPVFYMAEALINCFGADIDLDRALRRLLESSQQIVKWRASLRHDLAGRIFHRLLEEAKYLGAYYTSIPAAAMLLKLALSPKRQERNWASLAELKRFRVADLACGTGTLLMASADVVLDNYVRACAQSGIKPDLESLHRILVENVIHGYDVLPSAIHLTAATLALRIPETPVDVTHLYALPLGGPSEALGSLEFLRRETINGTLFGKPERITGRGLAPSRDIIIPDLDLCVMNPPFTRSVGGNLLFGNLAEEERSRLQQKLKKTVKEEQVAASITAGLGSVFVALGDRHLKPNGRIALVLPRALLSGVAWKQTRDLLAESYELEYLIVSHDPRHWNFSENTDLSEVLVIARKLDNDEPVKGSVVTCVNLWQHPRTAIEALDITRSLEEQEVPDLGARRGAAEVMSAGSKFGEAVSIRWQELRRDSWNFPCSFAQTELLKTLYYLRQGSLHLPRQGVKGELSLCPLRDIGELGFDCRDMHDAFRVSRGTTVYPAFWNHDTSRVTSIRQEPNAWLHPLSRAKEGRPLRDADRLWERAGRVLLAERLRLNKMRTSAVRVATEVLSNVWWSLKVGGKSQVDVEETEKALVLWLNSTLGILSLMGERQETEGAWVKFKKPVLSQMMVLDVRKLKRRARKKLSDAYDRIALESLLPLPEIEADRVRAEIDAAIADALDLPDVGILRELLAREPIISLTLDKLISV